MFTLGNVSACKSGSHSIILSHRMGSGIIGRNVMFWSDTASACLASKRRCIRGKTHWNMVVGQWCLGAVLIPELLGTLVKINGIMDSTKYQETLGHSLVAPRQKAETWLSVDFSARPKAKSTQKCLNDNKISGSLICQTSGWAGEGS